MRGRERERERATTYGLWLWQWLWRSGGALLCEIRGFSHTHSHAEMCVSQWIYSGEEHVVAEGEFGGFLPLNSFTFFFFIL